jgi:uncharacterized protein YceH (UPF0502 family)
VLRDLNRKSRAVGTGGVRVPDAVAAELAALREEVAELRARVDTLESLTTQKETTHG